MYKIFLATVLMGYLLPGALAACEPDCTGKNVGDHVKDPKDCRSYYICMAGHIPSDHNVQCPGASHFDPDLGECGGGPTCKVTCVLPDCHMTCSEGIDLISDPLECKAYQQCLAGIPQEKKYCPDIAPYFNGISCGTNKDECCSELCTPYCYSGMVQAPDPTDCHSYYICVEEGLANENYHYTCEGNMVFDFTTGHCLAEAQCVILCDGDGSGNIGTTTTTPSPGNVCMDSYLCTSAGYVAQCTNCQSGYFECSGSGVWGTLKQCSGGKVFNTNPFYAVCVSPSNCPYYP